MRLEYQVAVVGQDQLKRVLRSIEAEATAAARRGAQRDQRMGRQRVVNAQATARGVARSETAIERERQRHAARMRAHEHRLRMADLRERERAIRRETEALKQQNREIDRQIRASRRRSLEMTRARERTVGRVMTGAGRIASGTAGVIGGGIRTAGGLVTVGGTLAVGNAARTQMDELALASSLANQAGSPQIKGELLRESQQVQGFTGSEVLEAMSQFAGITGDLDAARGAMADLAQLALATGTNLEDLAAAAGNAFVPIADEIQDPQRRLEELLSTMRAIAGQGAIGAVEIKDLASEMAGLSAATNKFRGDPADLIKTVGAMAQAARQRGGAASSSEAVTSVSRFVADIVSNADKFEQSGIRVFADQQKTQLLDPREIMVQMLQQTGGDLTKVSDLFGVYAERAVAGFSPLYTAAERERRGSGVDAVQEEFARLLAAELTQEQIQEQASSRLEDPDLQFKEVVKDFNREVGQRLLPELTKLIPELAKLTPHVAELVSMATKAVEFFGENPFAGLGILVSGMVVKEVAAAGIGAAIKAALLKLLGESSIPIPGKAPGAPGAPVTKTLTKAAPFTLGAGAGFATLAGVSIANAALLSDQIEKEEKRDPGKLTSTRLGTSMWAGPAMAGVPMTDVPDRPGQGEVQKLDVSEFRTASREMAEHMKRELSGALSEVVGNIAINRTNPMSKR